MMTTPDRADRVDPDGGGAQISIDRRSVNTTKPFQNHSKYAIQESGIRCGWMLTA
ncbi:hypothetical protein [Bradyrhizobium mercantei]|uniref:hypothetical protein n=1 Tax=Bradyrhizobium mercantei TaxID=1904807 RepID=UPI001AED0FA1|nr:hypothetical protein [Bradyrhizobium mercantei]